MQSKNTETDRKITHITFYLTRLVLGKKRCCWMQQVDFCYAV